MLKLEKAKNKISYFREVKEEFKKISWTSKKELILSTRVVIISIFLFGLVIYFADILIKTFLTGIGAIVRFLG